MIRLIIAIFFVLLAGWFGLKLKADPGYVLIAYGQHMFEMPLWLLIAALIVFYVAFRLIIRLFNIYGNTKAFILNWLQRRRIIKARKMTTIGLLELSAGNWQVAANHLISVADNSNSPTLNYLAIAKSSQELGDINKRNAYLDKAYASSEQTVLPVQLTHAQLLIDNHEHQPAIALLKQILKQHSDNTYAAKLLLQCYEQTSDWHGITSIIPTLSKDPSYTKEQLVILGNMAYENILSNYLLATEYDKYINLYNKLSTVMRNQPAIIALHINYHIKTLEITTAYNMLTKQLKHSWSPVLIEMYGKLLTSDSAKQLKFAESFLLKHGDAAELHTAIARIAYQNNLLEKARSHYEESISLHPDPLVYKELGDLLSVMSETDLSGESYKQGLLLAIRLENI